MDSSPLMKLPAEIRNNIYELALYEEYGLMPVRSQLAPQKPSRPANPFALALCCRQLYHECLRLFYNINRFWLQCMPASFGIELEAFTNSIGKENAAVLRDIRFTYGVRMVLVAHVPGIGAATAPAVNSAQLVPANNAAQLVPTNSTAASIMNSSPSSFGPDTSIDHHLTALYLNIRDNSTISNFCRPVTNVIVSIAFWVDDVFFTEEHPYLLILDCGNLDSSLEVALDKTKWASEMVRGGPATPSERYVVLSFLAELGSTLVDLAKRA